MSYYSYYFSLVYKVHNRFTYSVIDLNYIIALMMIYYLSTNVQDSFTYLVIVNDRFTYCLSHNMVIIMILSLYLRSDYAPRLVWPECPIHKLS